MVSSNEATKAYQVCSTNLSGALTGELKPQLFYKCPYMFSSYILFYGSDWQSSSIITEVLLSALSNSLLMFTYRFNPKQEQENPRQSI